MASAIAQQGWRDKRTEQRIATASTGKPNFSMGYQVHLKRSWPISSWGVISSGLTGVEFFAGEETEFYEAWRRRCVRGGGFSDFGGVVVADFGGEGRVRE